MVRTPLAEHRGRDDKLRVCFQKYFHLSKIVIRNILVLLHRGRALCFSHGVRLFDYSLLYFFFFFLKSLAKEERKSTHSLTV
jgi:hypothetical protein